MPKTKEVADNPVKPETYARPTWDEYFMNIVDATAKRATCNRGRTGCVIVKDNQILVTGYVGSAAGDDHCDDAGHIMQKRIHEDDTITEHCVRTVHAEQNAICQAARHGVSIEGATLYCKLEPCPVCAKLIINSGIRRVLCQKRYHAASESRRVFDKCGVKLESLVEEVLQY